MISLRSGVKLDLMKKLSAYLFLILFSFSAPSFADDIIEFEIEGMSLGDSLLDYMLEEEIKENVGFVYEDIFVVSLINKTSLIYDEITVTYKSKDKKYNIYGIAGIINFPNNIENCYKQQDKIVEEISMDFNHWGILIFREEENSTYKPITYEDKNGDAISVSCYNYPKEPKINNLKVSFDAKEFKNYITRTPIKAN